MNVAQYIKERLNEHKMHMTLIDPDKQEPKTAGEIACLADKSGTDALWSEALQAYPKEK